MVRDSYETIAQPVQFPAEDLPYSAAREKRIDKKVDPSLNFRILVEMKFRITARATEMEEVGKHAFSSSRPL